MPRPGRVARLILVLGWLVAWHGPSGHVHAQQRDLPPLVYVCPMHSDQVSDHDGECPICKMGLEPMRLDQVYTCPIHSVVSTHEAGKCPICGRTLGEVTVSVVFRCTGDDTDLVEPQRCKDGTQAVRTNKSLAHGNHNAQYGGQFFMAADSWHHLEGVYPSPGVFRVYLFDDYTKPLPRAKVLATKARVVTKEETNPQTFETREVAAVPLTPSPDGPYLEAAIDAVPLPANITVQIVFDTGGKEQRFDFTFAEHSVANAAEGIDATTRLAMDIPGDAPGVLKMLVERRDAVKDIVGRGGITEVWVPALQAKDLALALEYFAQELPTARRAEVDAATRQIVLAAFRLDGAGDRGERDEVQKASELMVKAVDQIAAVFGGRR
jgi:hypothetical protein